MISELSLNRTSLAWLQLTAKTHTARGCWRGNMIKNKTVKVAFVQGTPPDDHLWNVQLGDKVMTGTAWLLDVSCPRNVTDSEVMMQANRILELSLNMFGGLRGWTLMPPPLATPIEWDNWQEAKDLELKWSNQMKRKTHKSMADLNKALAADRVEVKRIGTGWDAARVEEF